MAASKPRFVTRFLASAHLYTPPAEEQMVAMASLDKLRALLPPGVDPEAKPALLFVAANLAVGGVTNLNGDAMTVEDTLRTYRGFEWQLVDVEHDRNQLRGFIVKAGLSELGTDRLISEAEARAAGNPVNIAVVLALWKVVDPDLCAFIERMDAPASPDRGKLSLSFEVGFDDYDIAVLPNGATNLALATQIVTPDQADFVKYDRLLRVNGGKGALGKDSTVARVLMGNIVPLGAGIVTVPAAAVKGLTTITSNPHVETSAAQVSETDAGLYKYSSTQVTLSAEDAAPFLAYAASIPEAHIYTDPDDPTLGRGKEPHVSILYGIHTADHTQVAACLKDVGPMSLTFGEVAVFSDETRPYDVLHVSVDSPDLQRACALLTTAVQYTNKYVAPGGSPTLHLTLSYVKRGMAAGYVGDTRFKGRGLTVPSISFSPHTGDRIEIPLKMVDGTPAAPSPCTDMTGQVPVQTSVKPDTSMAQSDAAGVYSDDTDDTMATASRQIKLSEGWQTQLAALQTEAGKQGNAPLVNGVNITLSDGRTFSNVKVFDGQTLELDKELSMSGVVITSMTPGVPPQADSPEIEHPHKALVYPTTSPEQQARDAANEAQRHAGQNAAYTDASVEGYALTEDEVIAAAKDAKKPYGDVQYADPGYQKDGKKRYPIDTEEHIRAAWSYINKAKNCGEYTPEQCAHIKAKIVSAWKAKIDKAGPEGAKGAAELAAALESISNIFAFSAANLVQFGSSLFAVTNTATAGVSPTIPSSPMDITTLKQSLAAVKSVEDLPTVVANVTLFADAIAAASEKLAAERKTAQEAAQAAQASVDQIKADLEKLTATHNEMVAAQQAKAAQDAFDQHMAAVEATFDLDTEVRAEIVDEVKAASTDEAFAKWMTSAKKKMKGFMKKKGDDKGEPDGDEAKAAAAAKVALASAANNPVDPAHTHDYAATAALADQMKNAFAAGVSINGIKVKDLSAKK